MDGFSPDVASSFAAMQESCALLHLCRVIMKLWNWFHKRQMETTVIILQSDPVLGKLPQIPSYYSIPQASSLINCQFVNTAKAQPFLGLLEVGTGIVWRSEIKSQLQKISIRLLMNKEPESLNGTISIGNTSNSYDKNLNPRPSPSHGSCILHV